MSSNTNLSTLEVEFLCERETMNKQVSTVNMERPRKAELFKIPYFCILP